MLVGKELVRSSSLNPLLKHGQPQQVAQERVQLGVEYFHR